LETGLEERERSSAQYKGRRIEDRRRISVAQPLVVPDGKKELEH